MSERESKNVIMEWMMRENSQYIGDDGVVTGLVAEVGLEWRKLPLDAL